MKFSVIYLVLVSFTFLSLTPAGVSLAELRADDFELDELDLGLEEDEEEKSGKRDFSEDEEDSEESETGSKDDEESSEDEETEEKSEDDEDASASASSKSYDDGEDVSNGKKIAAFYFFEDSHALKSASHVAAETAVQLANSSDYDYVGTESSLFAVSSAKSGLKNARKKFEEGKALYADFNADEAIEKFLSALKNLEDNIDKIADIKFLSEVIFYIAASYKLIDEDEQAESYFSTYISLNPDSSPNESEFSSEVVSAFNSVKKNQGKVSKGSVKVSCNPDGALVFIDGKIAGITPLTLRGVREGKHYYRIHKNGYRDAGGSIVVKGSKTVSISETITKYSEASSILEAESEMRSDADQSSMLRSALEIARTLDVDNLLVIYTKVGADERVNYTGYMIDKGKREFKKSTAVFDMPEKGSAAKSESLKEFNKALIEDPYEYKSISDVFAAEVMNMTSDVSKDDKVKEEKKPVYKEWWLWTVVGVVVAGGVAAGVVCGLGKCTGGSGGSGATLDVNFQ